MKLQFDHDLHFHSMLSSCSGHPEQTTENLLAAARKNGFKTICLTDHFWDETVPGASKWYMPQNYSHISQAKPLPQAEGIRFLWGCETELDQYCHLGISKERMEEMDFIVVPTTHIHMVGFTVSEEDSKSVKRLAELWIERLDAVLDMDLPFHKVGIAHLTGFLFPKAEEDQLEMMALIPEEEMRRCFGKAAQLGVGIELNLSTFHFPKEQAELRLRPFKIAKECGCKFYFGSDAHVPTEFINGEACAEWVVDYLGLEESDKFII